MLGNYSDWSVRSGPVLSFVLFRTETVIGHDVFLKSLIAWQFYEYDCIDTNCVIKEFTVCVYVSVCKHTYVYKRTLVLTYLCYWLESTTLGFNYKVWESVLYTFWTCLSSVGTGVDTFWYGWEVPTVSSKHISSNFSFYDKPKGSIGFLGTIRTS